MTWQRKELKKTARETLKRNRINIIIVCFIIAAIASGYTFSTLGLGLEPESETIVSPPKVSSGVVEVIQNIQAIEGEEARINDYLMDKLDKKFTLKSATGGFIGTILNNAGGNKSFLVGLLNTINKFVFDGRILEGTIMAMSTVIVLLFWIFVQNILKVGECRFFLETKEYTKSNAKRLLFVYQVRRTWRVASIMLLRSLYTFLWSLTIIGGPIKYYAYRMIPFILAENPDISRKEAFALSKEMMRGNKWNAFKLDMSFFFWELLSILTFGILGFVFVNPYLTATHSELYFSLREQAIEKNLAYSPQLNDSYLLNPPVDNQGLYPMEQYTLPISEKKPVVTLEYDREYSLISLVYIFFAMAFVGWIWEVFIYLFKTGRFINRGTLLGPWLPIYGVGSLLILIILKPLIKKPTAFFISAFVVCGCLEYFTSWALETLFGQSWWDYSDVFFNINGRVSLEGLLFFATGGSLVAYVLAPAIDDMIKYIPKRTKQIVATVLILAFSVDVVSGFFSPNQGEGITTTDSAQTQVVSASETSEKG